MAIATSTDVVFVPHGTIAERCNDFQFGGCAPHDILQQHQVDWSFSTQCEQDDGYFSDSVYDEDEFCTHDSDDVSSVRSTTISNCSSAPVDKLAEENARLLEENRILRQTCEEIKKSHRDTDACGNSQDQLAQISAPLTSSLVRDTSPDAFSNGSMGSGQAMPQELPNQMIACFPGAWLPAATCMMQIVPVPMPPDHTVSAYDSTWHQQVGLLQSSRSDFEEKFVAEGDRLHNEVKRSAEEWGERSSARTTVMLRNLPNNYNREMLLDLIDSQGFGSQYDFLYLPIDFNTKACFGYAFVNLVTHEAANQFRAAFDGFSNWAIPSRKCCMISWSDPHQGLNANIERYRNSPVMHAGVPDEHKPVVFNQGVRVCFPEQSKKLRAPRTRNYRKHHA
jgi:hypothetical protein